MLKQGEQPRSKKGNLEARRATSNPAPRSRLALATADLDLLTSAIELPWKNTPQFFKQAPGAVAPRLKESSTVSSLHYA